MTQKENIKDVAMLNPNYLGFIFHKTSIRFFDDTIPLLPKGIKKVGVFVNTDVNSILRQINKHNLQAIQLHGQESPEICKILKHKNVEVIKVFSIKEVFDFNRLKPYEPFVDFFLFDTKGKYAGGNGYTFNWEILKDYPSTIPYFLSGGIGLDTIDKLNAFLKTPASKYCHALDVNSKFEVRPGIKNVNALTEFKSLL